MRASINTYQMAKTAEIRGYFLKASLSFEAPERDLASILEQTEPEAQLEPVSFSVVADPQGEFVRVSIDIGKNPLNGLLLALFYAAERLNDECWLVMREVKNSRIIAHAKPKHDALDAVAMKLEEELAALSDKPLPCGIVHGSPGDFFRR